MQDWWENPSWIQKSCLGSWSCPAGKQIGACKESKKPQKGIHSQVWLLIEQKLYNNKTVKATDSKTVTVQGSPGTSQRRRQRRWWVFKIVKKSFSILTWLLKKKMPISHFKNVCMCVCVQRRPKEAIRGLRATATGYCEPPDIVLGTEHRFFARVVNSLHYWATEPSLWPTSNDISWIQEKQNHMLYWGWLQDIHNTIFGYLVEKLRPSFINIIRICRSKDRKYRSWEWII